MSVRVVPVLAKVAFVSVCSALMWNTSALAAEVGILKCRFNGVDAAIHFGAKRTLECTFRQKSSRRIDRYLGLVEKYGIEVGIIGRHQLVWRVTSEHKRRLRRGALAGRYSGVTAEASVGAGIGASILTGGPSKKFRFHPLSFQKVAGLNVTAGVMILTLKRKR